MGWAWLPGSSMLVVHATKKLLDRVGTPTIEPTTRSNTVLGSWYATVLFWRPQVALLVNERTLLLLLMPLAPAATLLGRLPSWIDATLDAHGVPRTLIGAELVHAADIGLAKTNNRSVLGVMNEFARLANWQKEAVGSDEDLIAVALKVSEVPTSPPYKRYVSPNRELATVIAEAL